MSTPTPSSVPGAPTGQQSDPTAPPTGQAPTATAPPVTPVTPATGAPADTDTAATIARLESDLAAARKDAGRSRVTAKQAAADEARAELTTQLLGILDPSQAGQPATPEQLTQQLTAAQEQARQTAVELAVYRTAPAAGANPDALLDSRAFAAAVAALDPTDTAAVTAAIQAAITANPQLAAQTAPTGPTRGGAEFNGAPTTGPTAAQFGAMDYAARVALYQTDPNLYAQLSAAG
jgi:hypothetical protein